MGRRTRRHAGRRSGLGLTLTLLLVALGAAGLWLWPRGGRLPEPPLTPPHLIARDAVDRDLPPDAAPPPLDDREARQDSAPPVAARDLPPRLAIVIDDLGQSLAVARSVLRLEPPLTIAVIPFTAEASAVAAAAVRAGREVILHLPLEPEAHGEMIGGRGFLETGMTAAAIDDQLERDLRAVPYIVGVNGHMGSRFTSDPGAMEVLLRALRRRGLFFLDSRTSAESVAAPIAARLGVAFGERSVFLDHEPTTAEVERRLDEAVAIAKRHGSAIAIGHPHAATIDVLARRLAGIGRDGVRVVPASVLMR